MASHLKPSFKALGVSLKGKTAFFIPVNTLGEKKNNRRVQFSGRALI